MVSSLLLSSMLYFFSCGKGDLLILDGLVVEVEVDELEEDEM